MTIKSYALSASLLALTLGAAPAVATDLTASMWLPQTYPQAIHAYIGMFDRIREISGGELNVEVFYGGSLLPARTTLEGTGGGAADIGFIYPSYTPADVPIQAFLNNASFVSDDSLVVALAYTEINFTNPAALAEWAGHNVVFTGAYSTPVYRMQCNREATTLEQANGLRFRTAGASFTQVAESLGGTAVSVPIGDAYSGMQRGSLDCILADPTNLTAASFNEVVTDITDIPLGVVTGANWVVNTNSWTGLTDDERALLLDEMARATVRTQMEFSAAETNALDDARERGINIHEPGDDLLAHINEFKAGYISNLIANAPIENAQAIFDEYTALQAEWSARLEGVDRTDEEALLAIVREHLFSQFSQ